MKREEMEFIVELFTKIQTCEDNRSAFLNGALYGLGFAQAQEPNWKIIENLIQEGEDRAGWLEIEKECIHMYKEMWRAQIKLIKSMLKSESETKIDSESETKKRLGYEKS